MPYKKSSKHPTITLYIRLLLCLCFLISPINSSAKTPTLKMDANPLGDNADYNEDLLEESFDFDDEFRRKNSDIHEDEIHPGTDKRLKYRTIPNNPIDNQGYPIKTAQIIAIGVDNRTLDILHGLGYTVIHERWLKGLRLNVVTLSIPSNLTAPQALAILRKKDPNSLYDLNHLYHVDSTPKISRDTLNPQIHSRTANEGKTVGLIDTALERAHPALQKASLHHRDFVTEKQPRPTAHGTAIASQLVSQVDRLYSASVFYQDAQLRNHASVAGLTSAIDWLIEKKVAIINMSLSGPPNQLLHFIIRQASQRGHLIVAAAGNQGPASPPLYPAAYPEVVAVTAVDKQQRIYRRANRGDHVEVAAIGVTLRTADSTGGYTTNSGTSFAAPTVSAWLANTLQQPDPEQAQQVRRELHRKSKDLGIAGHDPVFGHGLISDHALEALP